MTDLLTGSNKLTPVQAIEVYGFALRAGSRDSLRKATMPTNGPTRSLMRTSVDPNLNFQASLSTSSILRLITAFICSLFWTFEPTASANPVARLPYTFFSYSCTSCSSVFRNFSYATAQSSRIGRPANGSLHDLSVRGAETG